MPFCAILSFPLHSPSTRSGVDIFGGVMMKKSTHDIEILTAPKRDIGEAFPKGTQMFGLLVGGDGVGLYRDVGSR
ncbi:MAG: hypothetical protein RLZZ338_2808 [Cyanobacteriota bacterium]